MPSTDGTIKISGFGRIRVKSQQKCTPRFIFYSFKLRIYNQPNSRLIECLARRVHVLEVLGHHPVACERDGSHDKPPGHQTRGASRSRPLFLPPGRPQDAIQTNLSSQHGATTSGPISYDHALRHVLVRSFDCTGIPISCVRLQRRGSPILCGKPSPVSLGTFSATPVFNDRMIYAIELRFHE